jgi:hypothetical protein
MSDAPTVSPPALVMSRPTTRIGTSFFKKVD